MSARATSAFRVSLAASFALHALLGWRLPGWETAAPEAPVLQAELVTLEPPAAKPQPSVAPPRPAPPAPRKTPPPAEPAAAMVPAQPSPATEATAAAAAEPAPEPAADSAPSHAQAPQPAQDPQPQAAQAAAEPAPVNSGTIRYELYYGRDRFPVGRSVQTWSIDADSYRLTSYSETTGLLGVFRPYLYAYVTEGKVDAGAFRPESFSVRRGREGKRQASARFDWNRRELTYGPAGAERSAPLTARSYDLLTLFFELARSPLAPGRIEYAITTGTRFNHYILEIGAEEAIESPLGTLRAIPVKQVRVPGEESVEVWLAPEKGNLPVRIRYIDREGRPAVEQLVTHISVGTVAADGR